ncbi:hypothetical protein DFH09DRAFT_1392111 [Mycena vulgaris]|nr:hypothetical protein DFH09DRAFT_1392111 [Mycena vulgaris]
MHALLACTESTATSITSRLVSLPWTSRELWQKHRRRRRRSDPKTTATTNSERASWRVKALISERRVAVLMTLVCADSAVSHSTSIAPLCTQRPSRRCRAPLPQYCECAAVAGHIRAGGLAAPSPYAWEPGWCRSLHGARGSAAMWDEPASLRGRPAVGRIATLQRRAFPLHALMSAPAPAAWASARHRLSRLGLVLWRAACALPRPDVCAFALVDREVSLVQPLPTSTSTIHFLHLAFWPASSSETHLLRLAMNSDFSSLRLPSSDRPPLEELLDLPPEPCWIPSDHRYLIIHISKPVQWSSAPVESFPEENKVWLV